jgi:hypothetical protein
MKYTGGFETGRKEASCVSRGIVGRVIFMKIYRYLTLRLTGVNHTSDAECFSIVWPGLQAR